MSCKYHHTRSLHHIGLDAVSEYLPFTFDIEADPKSASGAPHWRRDSPDPLFHQSQPRCSLLGSLGTVDLVIYSVTAFFVVRLIQVKTEWSKLPPHSWIRTADPQTREEVEATLSTAFNMARNAPTFERHDKLREVSFLVPHEVARLNKGAPNFHLEDVGPVSDGEIPWDLKKGGPPLDARTETRVFLYFPNGS